MLARHVGRTFAPTDAELLPDWNELGWICSVTGFRVIKSPKSESETGK